MTNKYIKHEVVTAIADNIVQTGDSVVDDIVHNPTNIETDVIDPAIKGITDWFQTEFLMKSDLF